MQLRETLPGHRSPWLGESYSLSKVMWNVCKDVFMNVGEVKAKEPDLNSEETNAMDSV